MKLRELADGIAGFLMMVALATCIIGVIMGAILIWPILLIWSANTLFPSLAIPFNSYTVLAAFILIMTLKARSSRRTE